MQAYSAQSRIPAPADRQQQQRALSCRLDLEYIEVRDAIVASQFYQALQKILKIRLKAWIELMDAVIVNPVWKRNRNNFAKLLDLMCDCEVLLEPFTQLPPKQGLPNISKHQINAVIDRVELAVKAHSNKTSQGVASHQRTNSQTLETPKQHWNKVRQVKENQSRESLEESSTFMRRFMDIVEKSNEVSQVRQKDKYMDPKATDSDKPVNKITTKKEQENDKANKISSDKLLIKANKENSPKRNGRMPLKLKVVESNPPTYFAKNARLKTHFSDNEANDPPNLYRDQHQSIEVTNQTLNTNSFEEYLDYDVSEISQGSCTERGDYNFSDQLSERCPVQEIHVQTCFNKQKIPAVPTRQNYQIDFPKQVPYRFVQLSASNCKNRPAQPCDLQESNAGTHIQLEQVVDERRISQSNEQEMRRFYWESNSLSYDLQCREQNQRVSIDENPGESCVVGEEGIINILRESTKANIH